MCVELYTQYFPELWKKLQAYYLDGIRNHDPCKDWSCQLPTVSSVFKQLYEILPWAMTRVYGGSLF